MCCNLCDANLDRPGQLSAGLQGDDVDTAIALARCTAIITASRATFARGWTRSGVHEAQEVYGKGKFSKEFSTTGREFKQRQSQMLKQALIQDFRRMPKVGCEFKKRQSQMLKQALVQDSQPVPKVGQA